MKTDNYLSLLNQKDSWIYQLLLFPEHLSPPYLEAVRAKTLKEIVPALLVVVDTAFGVGQPLEFDKNQPESKISKVSLRL